VARIRRQKIFGEERGVETGYLLSLPADQPTCLLLPQQYSLSFDYTKIDVVSNVNPQSHGFGGYLVTITGHGAASTTP